MPSTSWCYYEEIEQYLVWGGSVRLHRSHPIKAITAHIKTCRNFFAETKLKNVLSSLRFQHNIFDITKRWQLKFKF